MNDCTYTSIPPIRLHVVVLS